MYTRPGERYITFHLTNCQVLPRNELIPNILNSGQKLITPVAINTSPTTAAAIPAVPLSPVPSTLQARSANPAMSRIVLSIEPTFLPNAMCIPCRREDAVYISVCAINDSVILSRRRLQSFIGFIEREVDSTCWRREYQSGLDVWLRCPVFQMPPVAG